MGIISFLLRVGGFSLIFGTLLYTVAVYAAVIGGVVESSQVWLVPAHRTGIALMVLGCTAALAAVVMVIRKMLSRRTHVRYADEHTSRP